MSGSVEVVRYIADAVLPCDGTGRVFRPGIVDVAGDTIVHVGPTPRDAGRRTTDGPATLEGERRSIRLRGLLLPGLVNVHCHSAMTLFRGAGGDLPVDRWLRDVLWPWEARLTPEDVFWGMSLAASDLLARGVTTTCEMYFYEDAMADAVLGAGSRAVITPAVLQLPDKEGRPEAWTARLDAIADFHSRRHGEDGRIEVGVGPHAAYSVPLPVLVESARMAQALGALLHIHVAETEEEVTRFAAEHGCSAPKALADAGVLDGRVLAAHSIWLSEDDMDIYRLHDVAVGHCPQSNAKLASGIAALTELAARGIRVGLGTDGPASNNHLDLWEEMRMAALLARLRERDAGCLSATAALDLATRGGAAALGRSDLGVLAEGKQADMVLVDMDDSAFVPLLDDAQLVEHVVWSASSRLVTDTWVAGCQVVQDRRCLTVDVDEACRQVGSRARRLLSA